MGPGSPGGPLGPGGAGDPAGPGGQWLLVSVSAGQKRVLRLGDPGAGWSNRSGGQRGQEGLGALEVSSFQGYPQLRPDQGFLGAQS